MSLLQTFFMELRTISREFVLSWLRAVGATGDGPPSWFWPSIMTGSVVSLTWFGFYYAKDRGTYVVAVLTPFAAFCGVTFVAWLTYRYGRNRNK